MSCLSYNFKTQQHKFVNWQCDMEYRGSDFTTAVTLGNPDVLLGSGLFNSKIQMNTLDTFVNAQKDLSGHADMAERPRARLSL